MDHLPEVLLGILSTPVALLGETRPLGFYLPLDFSERPYLYHPVSKVCVRYTFKRQNTLYIAGVSFREQFISQCLVGSHICTKPVVKVYMCVCETSLKDGATHSVLVFQRTFYCRRHFVLSFPENSFFFSTSRRKSVIFLYFTLFLLSQKPPHGSRLL